AIYIAGSGSPVISNTIVVSNSSGIYAPGATALSHNDVWHNLAYNYSVVTTGTSDISLPPYFADYVGDDFHLQPGSPCVDAGDPHTAVSLDFEGDPRPIGGEYDIGADEATERLGVEFYAHQSAYGFPGQVLTYTHYLVNTGTQPDTYHIAHALVISGTGSDWQVGYTSIYTLAPGATAAVPMTIHIATDAVSGTLATVYLTATSDSSVYSSAVTSNTTGINRNWGAALAPAYAQVVDPGTVLTYVHTLTNTGNAPDTFDIAFDSTPGGWAQVTPDQVTLPSGGTTQIYVRLEIPASAAGGVIETTAITATSLGAPPNSPTSASISDTTEINYSAGDRYVTTSGFDSLNNCTIITQPCRSVGQAIAQAVSGDIVKVAQGTYYEHDLDVNKSITLQGGYSDADPDFTVRDPALYPSIIDAERQGRIFYILGNPTVEGFTLRNGYSGASGGGVYIGLSAPTLRDNIIEDNEAFLRGGGIYNSSGSPTLERNVIHGNLAGTDGGGFYNNGGSPDLWSNVFYNNQADNGGGFYSSSGSPSFLHNTLYANTADGGNGGGLYLGGGSPDV
ncbi:MAG TPA: DUF1565 domain-containing protein, partial [Anaerolineae bacterium]|nr:DUF1565 domain-containing protein [Anaerolineae bacterium]